LKRKGYSGISLSLSSLRSFSRLSTLTPLPGPSILNHLPSTHPLQKDGDSSTYLLSPIFYLPLSPIFYFLSPNSRWSMVDTRANNPGEGFNSSGTPLSGLKKDEYHGKLTGLAAAEKRLAVQKKIGKGGVLGGSSVLGRSMKDVLAEVCSSLLSILSSSTCLPLHLVILVYLLSFVVPLSMSLQCVRRADDQAAERRMKDDKSCHTAHPDVQAEVKKAEQESEGVDADQLDNASPSGSPSTSDQLEKAGPSRIPATSTSSSTPLGVASRPPKLSTPAKSTPSSNPSSSARPIPKSIPKSEIIDLTDDDPHHTPVSTEWSCPTCTLLNPVSSRTCEACTTHNPTTPPLPSKKGDGWFCDFCGSGPRDMSFWSCSECGWVRKWG